MQDLTIPQWKEKLASDHNAFILDVRTQEEADEGIISGARVIDIHQGPDFISAIQKLDKSKNYYVYCRSGGRSAQACALMSDLGFETTYNLLGGYTDWVKEDA